MGVNWDSVTLYWRDHTPTEKERYSLSHLHPFIHRIELISTDKHPARTVDLQISFGLHTFTRSTEPHDMDHEIYQDNRESRTFCHERYQHSFRLPHIIRTLDRRRCEFAHSTSGRTNYVTVETSDGRRYAAFFDLRRFQPIGPNGVRLAVQSAYMLDPHKPVPGKGRIHFHALLGHVLRGTTPHRPH